MAKRFGAVLQFKEGVERAEAVRALRQLKDLLDLPDTVFDYETGKSRPITGKDIVREYDDNMGGPVWYIP